MAGTMPRRVDPANSEQAAVWDGAEGAHWARHADAYDAAVRAYHAAFLAAAELRPGDRVLDIGCGTGQSTCDAARLVPLGGCRGLDLSARMLAVAGDRARAQGLRNIVLEQADAQVHALEPGAYDAAISRTGAMFFGRPAAAFANIARALRPGGRLVLLVWQDQAANEWAGIAATLAAGRSLPSPSPDRPGPFSLADPDRTRSLLESSGFTGVSFRSLRGPLYLGRTAPEAEELLVGQFSWLLGSLDASRRARAVAGLRHDLEAHRTPEGVAYDSAAWLITARRP